jgi:hypothetical protein
MGSKVLREERGVRLKGAMVSRVSFQKTKRSKVQKIVREERGVRFKGVRVSRLILRPRLSILRSL